MSSLPDTASSQPLLIRPELAKERRCIDWSAIELDYRAGGMSLREMASKHGCSHSAIANFAGRHGWSRNAEADEAE
jgi:uncharacterized protein YjcR